MQKEQKGPNCQHLDNYRTCRILHGQGRIQRALGIRPGCVLDQEMPPQDGEWTCDEQKPFPQPVRFGGPYFSVLAQPYINSEAPTDLENSPIPPKGQGYGKIFQYLLNKNNRQEATISIYIKDGVTLVQFQGFVEAAIVNETNPIHLQISLGPDSGTAMIEASR